MYVTDRKSVLRCTRWLLGHRTHCEVVCAVLCILVWWTGLAFPSLTRALMALLRNTAGGVFGVDSAQGVLLQPQQPLQGDPLPAYQLRRQVQE